MSLETVDVDQNSDICKNCKTKMARGNKVTSLQDLAGFYTGALIESCLAANKVKLADLPNQILDQILSWISAESLVSLDMSGMKERGYDVDELWQSHVTARWMHRKPSQRNPFRIGSISYRQFYMDEYFKECFNYLSNSYLKSIPSLGVNPRRDFGSPLKLIRFASPEEEDEFDDDYKLDMDHLISLAPHVRTLTIQYKQWQFLEENPELLHALIHHIDTLSLQNLSTRGSLTFIRKFVQYARIEYLDVTNCVWDETMMAMLNMMAGQMSQVQLAKIESEMSPEIKDREAEIFGKCTQCTARRNSENRGYQVPSLLVENQTIHPISDSRFVNTLHGWSGLQQFIHICSPLSTLRVEEEIIRPVMETLAYLVRFGNLKWFHLNGPYHLTVMNLVTDVTQAKNVARLDDIAYNTLIHCNMTCSMRAKDESNMAADSRGIVSLELNSVFCDTVLRRVLFNPVIQIVAGDDALQHLSLESFRQFPDTLVLIFRAIAKRRRLVSLDISGNYVQRSGFGDLVTMIKECDTLRTLVVDYCELPTRPIYVQEMAEAVAHSNLTTFSVANNRLGQAAAQMVVDVLRIRNERNSRIHSLNIGQNCIKYDAVEDMHRQLMILRSGIVSDDCLITNLSIDDVLGCDGKKLSPLWDDLRRSKVVKTIVSRNDLLSASRATMLGYVAQMSDYF